MKITVNKDNNILFEDVFTGVIFKSPSEEEFAICMRDTGFEFTYEGKQYFAKEGRVGQKDIKTTTKKAMMTPKEFLDKLASDSYYKSYECMRESRGINIEIDNMKAYALHVLERAEKEVSTSEKPIYGKFMIWVGDDLKSIFEEIKKELNGETETRQTFDCKVCGKPFGDKLSLYNHFDEEHNRDF